MIRNAYGCGKKFQKIDCFSFTSLHVNHSLTDMEYTTPPPPPCKNKLGDKLCNKYAKEWKVCDAYKEYLADKCAVACNACPAGTKTTTTTTTTPKPCENKIADDKCAMYKSWGACDRKGNDGKYMKMNCSKACHFC